MRLDKHLIYGSVATVPMFFVFGNNCVFFWLGSIFIDVDHYFDFIYHNRWTDFRPKYMFDYHYVMEGFLRRPDFLNIEVFHTIEFIAPLLFVSIYMGWGWLLALVAGFIFHIALDMVALYRFKAFFKRCYSFPEYLIRRARLKKQGLDPEAPYQEALNIVRDMEWQMKRF